MSVSKERIELANKRAIEALRLKNLGCRPKEIAIRLGMKINSINRLLNRAKTLT
jgi:DNA-binding CsgD family transcriptional regulator